MITRLCRFVRGRMMQWQERQSWREFLREWNALFPDCEVVPMNRFPMHLANVGKHSYGELNLIAYDPEGTDKLSIGAYVSISSDVRFFLNENHQTKTFTSFPLRTKLIGGRHPCDMVSKGAIHVADEVWIGNRVSVLSGVTIGKGAIIAAGSVVAHDIPPYCIAGGVPAKVIRKRFPDEIISQLLNIYLKKIPENVIRENMELFYSELNGDILLRISGLMKEYENG